MGNICVSPGGKVTDSLLNERALGISRTEEGQVRQQEDPASPGEGKSRQHQAEQEHHFERSNKTHAGLVILPGKLSKGLSQRRPHSRLLQGGRGSCTRRSGLGGLNAGLEGRDQVRLGISRNVEDRIHGEWQECQRNLAGVKPHQSHS